MDIQDFKARKKALEAEIAAYIQQLLADFTTETGVIVTDVEVEVLTTQILGCPVCNSVVGGVSLNVDI